MADDAVRYSMRTAARLLSTDPAITIGRLALFVWLVDHGLATRTATGYRPTHVAEGLVELVPASGRPGQTWDQIVLTLTGLRHLHVALGGVHALDTDLERTP